MTVRLLIRGDADSYGVLAEGWFISTRRSDSPSERGGGFWPSRELSSGRMLLDSVTTGFEADRDDETEFEFTLSERRVSGLSSPVTCKPLRIW